MAASKGGGGEQKKEGSAINTALTCGDEPTKEDASSTHVSKGVMHKTCVLGTMHYYHWTSLGSKLFSYTAVIISSNIQLLLMLMSERCDVCPWPSNSYSCRQRKDPEIDCRLSIFVSQELNRFIQCRFLPLPKQSAK